MKCCKCKEYYQIKMGNLKRVFSKQRNNLFYCDECNRIERWKTEHPFEVRFINQTVNHCDISYYHYGIEVWIEKTMANSDKLYEVTLCTDKKVYIFPEKYENDYLYGKNDTWNLGDEGKFHEKGDKSIRLPIDKIKCIDVIEVTRDYIEPDVEEPIYGYKGMPVRNGVIIGSDRYTYTIGVPYIEEKKGNPYAVDYQDCYSHFCLKMEEPLLYWGRDYIYSYVTKIEKNLDFEYKLYKIKAEKHCHHNTKYGWVSNHLTLVEEVTKEEIIDYYEKNPEILEKIQKYWEDNNITVDVWDKYKEYVRG